MSLPASSLPKIFMGCSKSQVVHLLAFVFFGGSRNLGGLQERRGSVLVTLIRYAGVAPSRSLARKRCVKALGLLSAPTVELGLDTAGTPRQGKEREEQASRVGS